MRVEEFTEITMEVSDGVAAVTLNRPERRNAWGGRTAVEWRWALHHADVDPGVRVVVLTGAGEHFCVGADSGRLESITRSGGNYTKMEVSPPPYPESAPEEMRKNHLAPLLVSTPVIAAVTGACAGVGFLVASYADLRFVASDARVTTSFAKLGLPAEYGLGWLLPRMVGVPNALEMLYSAAVYDGAELLRLGWAQRSLPVHEVRAAAMDYARNLARHSSGESLRMMKRQIMIDAVGPVEVAYRRSVEDMNAALRHPDMKEGLAALRERRPTNFLGQAGPVAGNPMD
jgi:enoyl-CoA hydratase/carnithine racemase